MSTPNEWMQYQTSYISDISQIFPQPTADASFADSRNINLAPNYGRISKPLRRRSRASRRTPTTLFNTDTANFRSMVQRFTGAPSISTFSATPQPSGGGETFALDEAATAINHAPDPAAGFHMQYSHPLGQQQQVFTINRMQEGRGEAISSHAPPGFSSTTDHRNYDYYMM
ncbi:VQ motif-containing protein 22-like [Primulina eburnea]|uniref:VQ motif-containing protein 22-like n=1 Tax=Primulina eburnea TaxID=1245227 RepID=UPI003C6C34CD